MQFSGAWHTHRGLQTPAQRLSRIPLQPVCRSPRGGHGGVEDRLHIPAMGLLFSPGLLLAQVRVPSERTEYRPHLPLVCGERAQSWPSGCSSFGPLLVPVVCRRAPRSIRSILHSVRESWFLLDPLSHLKMRLGHGVCVQVATSQA